MSQAPGEDRPPRFIADAMLGGLARWLRVLGLDAAYDPELGDAQLVRRAAAESRVILTRDRRLVLRRSARDRHYLVASQGLGEQLREVLGRFGITPRGARVLSRCLRCNELLEDVPAAVARERVPPYVARTQERFRRCPACERIYWSATHVERMRRRLDELGVDVDW